MTWTTSYLILFSSSTQLLRQEPKQVEDRVNLKELLKVASGGVIFTTIQKFQPESGNVYETLSERKKYSSDRR